MTRQESRTLRTNRDHPGPTQSVFRLTAIALCTAFTAGGARAADEAPAAAADIPKPQAAPEVTLPVIRTTAKRDDETATGPVYGYVAKRSATGTKTDTPILETPQSVSVVTKEQVDALKSQNLTDALGYTAGISRLEGYDRTTDNFMIRGFEAYAGGGSFYRDGLKYTPNLYDGQQEPYGLERIEILKGASSVLFGNAAPGGIVNTVSKMPTLDPLHELNLEFGNNRRKQLSGDFSGALTEDGAWSYRLTGLVRDSNSFVDHVPDDRVYIAPALTWRPSSQTSLTLLAHYQRNRTAYVYGLPAEGTLYTNVNGQIPSSRFVGEPDFDKYDGEIKSAGYLFEHTLSEGLKIRSSLRHVSADCF
jgi:iron complex outermembrane recepter protein